MREPRDACVGQSATVRAGPDYDCNWTVAALCFDCRISEFKAAWQNLSGDRKIIVETYKSDPQG
jgi:hypothetical protein